MEDLEDIRSKYPNLAGYSDKELTQILVDKLGVTKEYAQNYLGVKPNTAGLGTDTAIDLGRGLVGVGRIVTGAADLATGGASGRAIKSAFGGDLNDVDAKLASKYSDKRQDAEDEIHNAKGFVDTVKAYMNNPRAAFGEVVQGAPSMLVPIGAAGRVAGAVERRLAMEAAEKGLEGAAAKQFISDGVRASTANKLATPAAWGGVSAAQTADQQVSQNPDDVGAMYKAAAGAGLVNAAGMGLSSKLPGGGAAQSFATGGLMNALEGNVIPRTAMAIANQAGTNAAINAGTTGAVNLANGRDFTQGMAESAAAGVAPGVAFGLAHGMAHGRQPIKTDGDGNVVVNGQSLPPEVAAQQMTQMQQEQAGRAQQAQAQAEALTQMRQATAEKYGGVRDDTFQKSDGTQGSAGFIWGGKKFTSMELVQKAIDAQIQKESAKPEGQMAGEHVLADVIRARGAEVTPENISNAAGLYKDAKSLMHNAETPDVVKVRIDRQIGEETKQLDALNLRMNAAEDRLGEAKKNTQETGGHDEAEVRAQKNLDSLKSKIEQQNHNITLLTEWSNGLEKIGANHGENARNTESTRSENNVPESTNRNTEAVRQDGENPAASGVNGAITQDSNASQGQRPELNGVAQQPHQEAQVTPPPPVEVTKAPEPATSPAQVAPVEPAKPVLSERAQQVVDALQSGLRPDQVMARMKLGVKDMQEIQNEVARAESGIGRDQSADLVKSLPAKLQRDVQIFRDYDMADSTRSLAEKHGVSQATVTRAVRDISNNLAKHGMGEDDIATILGRDHENISAKAAEEEAKAVTGATRGDVAAEVLENRAQSKAEPEHFGAEQGFAHVDTAGESHSGYKVGDDIGLAWEKLAAKHEKLSSALDAAIAPAEQQRLQRQLDAVTNEIVKLTETAKKANKKAAVAAGGIDDIAPVEHGETNYGMEQEGWEQDDNSRKTAGTGADTAQPRSDAEQHANDVALIKLVAETITPQLEAMGLGDNTPGLHRLQDFYTEPMPSDAEGKIVRKPGEDGVSRYEVVLASHIVESGDQAVITRVVNHEIGHAIDMSLDGGVYSAQPEMQFVVHPTNGSAIGIGPVAREIMSHFRDGKYFEDDFRYPLKDGLGYDATTLAKETFAQAWHLYQNNETRTIFEALLPKTSQYLSEVLKHAQDTTTKIHSSVETGAVQLRESFGARAERTGDSSATRGGNGREDGKAIDSGADKRDGGNASRATESLGTKASGPDQLYSRPASDTSAVERKAVAEQYIKKLPAAAQAPVRSITENIAHFATRGLQSAAFLHDLADWAGKHGMTAMKEVSRLYSEKGAFKSELDKRLGAVAEQYDRLSKADQKSAGEYLMAAQFDHDNGWGYQPEWRDKVSINAKAKEAWSALNPPIQSVVDAILRHNYEQRQELQRAFNDHINEMYDAKLEGVGPEEAKIIEAEREKALKQAALTESDGAYSPLKRFGDHVVTVRSEEMRNLMEDKAANRDEIRKLMSDPEHYQVMHYDSAGEAANKAVELQEKLGDKYRIEASEKAVAMQHGTQAFEVLQHMAESAANHTKDPEFAHALNNAMTYAIIKSMGEKSSRGSQLNRKLVGGMKPEEMIRAFVSNGYADNGILAAALHNREISQKMNELHQQVESSRSPAERKARQNFYNELQQRRINALKGVDPAPWVTHAMRFTTVWKLITSPAYYLQYISQPLTMAAPVIQGNHGYAAGMGALMRGLRESVAMMKLVKSGGKIEGADGARLMDMLNDLKKTGTISIGHTQQFGQYHSRPEGSLSRAWIRATDKVAQLPHEVEMHNRIGTALAAYRLEYSKAVSEGKSSEAAHKQATEYARDTINTAYGDYSSFNAPRIMSGGPIRRLVMQYRQFQAIHGAMLVRLMSNAFKGESADVRKAAKLQLAYMAGHYGVLAGAMGIPGAHLVAGALQSVFGDPDGPEDTETFIKRHVGNGAVGKLVTEGVPGLMGMKLSNRMGAGDIFSPFRGDTAMVPGTRKEYKDTALAVMGPFLGAMVPQVIDGVDRIGKGDYYRGLEQLMPKGIADVMKASRFATEGVSNRKGDTTLAADALDAGDIISQGLGAQPLKVADAQATSNVTHKFEAHFKDMVNELSFRFNEARKDGKPVDDIIRQWTKMQDAQRKEGFRPTPLSNLYQAPQRQRKREMATMGGVEYTKGNRGFVQSMTGEE